MDKGAKEMSTELLNILQMNPTEVTNEAVHREVSINPAKKNKENLLKGYRGWTWLNAA